MLSSWMARSSSRACKHSSINADLLVGLCPPSLCVLHNCVILSKHICDLVSEINRNASRFLYLLHPCCRTTLNQFERRRPVHFGTGFVSAHDFGHVWFLITRRLTPKRLSHLSWGLSPLSLSLSLSLLTLLVSLHVFAISFRFFALECTLIRQCVGLVCPMQTFLLLRLPFIKRLWSNTRRFD